jgi:hypothetical protein
LFVHAVMLFLWRLGFFEQGEVEAVYFL